MSSLTTLPVLSALLRLLSMLGCSRWPGFPQGTSLSRRALELLPLQPRLASGLRASSLGFQILALQACTTAQFSMQLLYCVVMHTGNLNSQEAETIKGT